jgi:WD40 repeat protein
VWDSSTGKALKVLEGHTDWVTSIAFSPDGRRIVSGSEDKSVRVWDSSTGETLEVLEGHTHAVTSVAFSPDDRRIVSGSDNVRVWVLSRKQQYIRQKTVDSFGNLRHTGWLLSPEEHYLMFLPSIALLPDYSNILTIPRSHAASVDFTPLTLGPKWYNCYHP